MVSLQRGQSKARRRVGGPSLGPLVSSAKSSECQSVGLGQWVSQSLGQSVAQWVGWSVGRLVALPFGRSVGRSLCWSVALLVGQWVGGSVGQPVDQAGRSVGRWASQVSRLVGWSVALLVGRSLCQSVGRWVGRSVGWWVGRWAGGSVGRWVGRLAGLSDGRSVGQSNKPFGGSLDCPAFVCGLLDVARRMVTGLSRNQPGSQFGRGEHLSIEIVSMQSVGASTYRLSKGKHVDRPCVRASVSRFGGASECRYVVCWTVGHWACQSAGLGERL